VPSDDDPGETLPEILSAAFDTFEAVRHLARRCEDQAPDLFPVFMSAAAAAAAGRDAIAHAPALPVLTRQVSVTSQPGIDAGPEQAADSIAASASALATALGHWAALAPDPRDRRACRDAASAATQICHLMERRP